MKKNFQVNTSNIRLDIYLQAELNVSRMQVKKWLSEGFIRVNKQKKRPSYLIQQADTVEIEVVENHPKSKGDIVQIEYLYEDKECVVLIKPAGLLVHPSDKKEEITLIECLRADNIRLFNNSKDRPGIVHRLDKMTEGLMVVAKTQESYTELTRQFKSRDIHKLYYAMVKGNIMNDDIQIHQPIARDPKHGNKFTVDSQGKDAYSEIRVVTRYNSKTLCSVKPKTGRTHQIRVHLNFIGHPILGDSLYSRTSRKSGQLLQAFSLGFTHSNGKRLTFNIPLSTRLMS